MGEFVKKTRVQKTREADTVEEIAPAPSVDTDEVDDLLNEIDDVLEENAEQFVKQYVQKGGE